MKIKDQIFQWIQKALFLAHFWSIFLISGAKKKFPENQALSCTTSYRFLAPCQNIEKTNDTILRKCPDRRKDVQKDRWKDRWNDGQTLFYWSLPATAKGPIKILDLCAAANPAITNTYFMKPDAPLVTYWSGNSCTQVDYILIRRNDLEQVQNVKVIEDDGSVTQNKLLVFQINLRTQETPQNLHQK